MEDKHDLKRFIDAQNYSYDSALKEIQNGRKVSHWMWYIFPQFKGLGRSATSQKYWIKNKEEAIAYLNHEVLGKRLVEITEVILVIEGKSAYEIFGRPDDRKLRSCMSLFALIQTENELFQRVLHQYYDGKGCRRTERFLKIA